MRNETIYGRLLHRQITGVKFDQSGSGADQFRYLTYEFDSEYTRRASCRERITLKLQHYIEQQEQADQHNTLPPPKRRGSISSQVYLTDTHIFCFF